MTVDIDHVASLIRAAHDPLTVPCMFTDCPGHTVGVVCAEIPGYLTKVGRSGFHPMRPLDAWRSARNALADLAGLFVDQDAAVKP